ncbi:MAG TPA: SRPBCC family protein [Burkholderiales bacterium]|nr:SRPBCC family protein [Burkholderiales bacterium]
MEFDNSFEVPLPPAEAWKVLLDIERVARCIPGAELTQVVDENTYKGKVAVRLGPVALSLAGQAKFEEIDHANRKARVRAHGADPKGRGTSDSVIDFRLEPSGSGTRVLIHTDVKLSGSIAQYGRGSGMIQSFAAQVINQFGETLKSQLAQSPVAAAPQPLTAGDAGAAPPSPSAPPRAKPISGLTLLARALRDSIARLFRRKSTPQ